MAAIEASSSQSIVIIVDENYDRGKLLAEVFENADSNVYLWSRGDEYEKSKWGYNWEHSPAQCKIAIVHDTNKGIFYDLNVSYDILVFYSGGKGPFPDGWVQRSVTKSDGLPSDEEATDLLRWVAEPKAERERWKPKLLTKPRAVDNLIALAVLCQGYLVVHAEYKGSEKDWSLEEIALALRQMGWTDTTRSMVRPDLGDEFGNVREAKWWLNVFGLWDGTDKQIEQDTENWKKFENEIKEEWGEVKNEELPGEFGWLLQMMRKKAEINSPNMVAKAYCEIAKKLCGKQCSI